MNLEELETPALLIDLDVLDENLRGMAALAARRGLALRPHAKSHKSPAIAQRQLDLGASGLCVATIEEAAVFAGDGVQDMVLAYPIVGRAKLDRLLPVLEATALTLVADSYEVAEGYAALARRESRSIPVLIEIDSGMNRAGVAPDDAGSLATRIARLGGLDVRGILTHAGQSHRAADQVGMARVARDEVWAMTRARTSLESAGFEVSVVSAGSTLTTPYLSAADGITEVRPGTYVFNDLRTLARYSCRPDQLALTMLTTVVSRGPGRATLDAGSKSITLSTTEQHGFGYPTRRPGSRLGSLSEEHGVLDLAAEDEDLRVGDRVRLLPIHSCVWIDLQREAYGVRGDEVVERIGIDASRVGNAARGAVPR